MSVVQGVFHGGRTGAQIGALGGPWGAAAGAVAGALIGGAIGWWAGEKLAQAMNSANDKAEEELQDSDAEECKGECAKGGEGTKAPDLPANPDELLDKGWKETSHPNAAKNGHRTFENPETGETIRFDEGKPGYPKWEGRDHYHRLNPGTTGRVDEYLDKNGTPVPRGSDASHIPPNRGGAGV